jgi:protein-S-isoprenylcysteine O-methyltransferase Ste14
MIDGDTLTQKNWRDSSEFRLSRGSQFIIFGLNVLFGMIPGLVLFFAWVDQNCSFFEVESQIAWSGEHWDFGSISFKILWNGGLFLAFGFFHSLLAQKSVQRRIQYWLPPQVIRSFYLCVTGLSLLGVMVLWQPLRQIIWKMETPERVLFWIAKFFYWSCMLYAGHLLTRFGAWNFFGLKQLSQSVREIERTEGTPELVLDGLYQWVRHPVYTLTLMAFLVTPEMSLGRLTLSGFTLIYLYFAIPVEERKLLRQFGESYRDYQTDVPALVPFLNRGWRTRIKSRNINL